MHIAIEEAENRLHVQKSGDGRADGAGTQDGAGTRESNTGLG